MTSHKCLVISHTESEVCTNKDMVKYQDSRPMLSLLTLCILSWCIKPRQADRPADIYMYVCASSILSLFKPLGIPKPRRNRISIKHPPLERINGSQR